MARAGSAWPPPTSCRVTASTSASCTATAGARCPASSPSSTRSGTAASRSLTFNDDALDRERRGAILDQLAPALGERGKVRPADALDRLRQSQAGRAGGEARGRRRGRPSPGRSASTRPGSAERSTGSSRRASTPSPAWRASRLPGRRVHRGGGPAADDPRDGHEPARLGPGSHAAGCSRPTRGCSG